MAGAGTKLRPTPMASDDAKGASRRAPAVRGVQKRRRGLRGPGQVAACFTNSGAGLKGSAKTPDWSAHEAALLYSLRLYGLQAHAAAYSAACRARKLHLPVEACSALPQPTRPHSCDGSLDVQEWIRAQLYVAGKDRSPRALRITELGVSRGSRETRVVSALAQLELWARLWADLRLRVRHVEAMGLGLFACAPLPCDAEVASAVLDGTCGVRSWASSCAPPKAAPRRLGRRR